MAGSKEADDIVIHALRDIGCKRMATKSFTSLSQVNGAVLTEAVARCINIIEESSLSTTMPPGVAKRHKYCTQLGKKLKGLGFSGDCGFQQFMYPNVKDARRILVWCVNKLPKVEDEDAEAELGAAAVLNRAMRASLKAWGEKVWRSEGAHGARLNVRTSPLELGGDASPRYCLHFMPLLTEQPSARRDIAVSVFEMNARKAAQLANREAAAFLNEGSDEAKSEFASAIRSAFAGKVRGGDVSSSSMPSLEDLLGDFAGLAGGSSGASSRFGNERTFETEEDRGDGADAAAALAAASKESKDGSGVDPLEAARQRKLAQQEADQRQFEEWDRELAELARLIEEATSATARDASAKDAAEARCRRLNAELAKALARGQSLERAYYIKEQTLKMLPEAASNIEKLQSICQKSAANLVKLAAKWETVRRSLIETYRHIKEAHTRRKHACKDKVREMKEMRAEMKGMAAELRRSEARLKFLLKEYAKLPKSVDRSLYTSRIMDIIAKVRKQNGEIRQVIGQIHDVQMAINEVGQKLLRTEKLTDRRMYEVASRSKDRAYVDAYRHLKDIRDAFENLVVNVQKVGRIDNEMVATRARIAQLKARNTDENMRQLQKDLSEVKKENEQFREKAR